MKFEIFNEEPDKIQQLALDIQKKEAEVISLEDEMNKIIQATKIFDEYKKRKQELEDFKKSFNEAAIKYLKKNDLKTSCGPAGKITLVQRNSYEIVDMTILPDKYQQIPVLETELKSLRQSIKNEFELFKNEIPGVKQNVSEYIRFTPSTKQSS